MQSKFRQKSTRTWTGLKLCSLMSGRLNSTMYQTAKIMSCGAHKNMHSMPRPPQMKFSLTVLVWGAITARGLTKLHIIPQKTSTDSSYYISEILEKDVKPAFGRTATSTDLTATKLFSISCDGWMVSTPVF